MRLRASRLRSLLDLVYARTISPAQAELLICGSTAPRSALGAVASEDCSTTYYYDEEEEEEDPIPPYMDIWEEEWDEEDDDVESKRRSDPFGRGVHVGVPITSRTAPHLLPRWH